MVFVKQQQEPKRKTKTTQNLNGITNKYTRTLPMMQRWRCARTHIVNGPPLRTLTSDIQYQDAMVIKYDDKKLQCSVNIRQSDTCQPSKYTMNCYNNYIQRYNKHC